MISLSLLLVIIVEDHAQKPSSNLTFIINCDE